MIFRGLTLPRVCSYSYFSQNLEGSIRWWKRSLTLMEALMKIKWTEKLKVAIWREWKSRWGNHGKQHHGLGEDRKEEREMRVRYSSRLWPQTRSIFNISHYVYQAYLQARSNVSKGIQRGSSLSPDASARSILISWLEVRLRVIVSTALSISSFDIIP